MSRARRLCASSLAGLAGTFLLNTTAFAAAPAITPAACPKPRDGAFCGTIDLPFDRKNPAAGTLAVGFRLYTPGVPPTGTVVARQGGPGLASTAPNFVNRVRAIMAPLYAAGWSELFVDQRGRGLSSPINCPGLQGGSATAADVAACAQSLVDATGVAGSAAGDYATAAAADDLEDVRQALVASGQISAAPIDLFGQSYAGFDLNAYAARYPTNLRSVVADSPATQRSSFFALDYPARLESIIADSCGLNDGCRPSISAFKSMVHTLAATPTSGAGYDYTGTVQTVVANEANILLSIVSNNPVTGVAQNGQEFLNSGELEAASRAWLAGDQAPLFRLLAENAYILQPAPGGNTAILSVGDVFAASCADTIKAPWSWSDAPSVREAAYMQAETALLPRTIAPWTPAGWNSFLQSFILGDSCVPWPTPPTHVGMPRTAAPTLALSGTLDSNVPTSQVQLWAKAYPQSQSVTLLGRGHTSAVRGDLCAQSLIQGFIADPAAPLDTRCAAVPQILPLATEAFPAKESRAAEAAIDPAGGDASRPIDRRQASVAIQTALDGLKRFTMSGGIGAGPAFSDVGLRGGSMTGDFTGDADGSFTVTLSAAQFTTDIAVTGTVTWDPLTYVLGANLTLARPGGAAIGSLTIGGSWRQPGEAPLKLRGTLNGRGVALLAPAT